MSRRTLGALILLTWVSSLAWLVQRHYWGAPRASDTPRWPVPPGAAFAAIRLGDRQYGLATLTVDTLRDGLRVIELVTLDLPRPTSRALPRTSVRVEALYSRGLQLQRWRSDLLTEHGRVATTGEVSGDSLLTVAITGRDERPETLHVALRRPVVLPSAIALVAASRGLPRTGTKLNVEVYDPIDQELRTEHIAVAAESVFTVPDSASWSENLNRWIIAHADTIRAWRLERLERGLPTQQWIDAAGMTIRLRHPLGAVIDRSAFELVNSNFRALPPAPWDTTAATPFYGPSSGSAEPARALSLVARLAPANALPGNLPVLEGGWQSRAGDTLRIAPSSDRDSAPDAMPLAEPLISSDDPGLARTAALIAGRERQADARALALGDWVRRTIALREGSGAASATRVFRDRRGTAAERVRLLVALARSVGMAARPVSGVVRADGRWLPHEWAEIWTGVWTPIDPELARTAPRAARVRLLAGGSGRLLDLALRAGRLRLDVLEETR